MAAEIIWFPVEKRYKYPHLSPADVAIWERYLDTGKARGSQVSYDVRVGQGQDPGDAYDPNIREMAIKLTQFRIDVLLDQDTRYQIIEVKHDPGSGAVGQLLSYLNLFEIDYPEMRPISLLLLCNRITPDLITVCQNLHVEYHVI